MKIKLAQPQNCIYMETDGKEFPCYKRYSPTSWTNAMGESWEIVNDTLELETAYQAYKAEHPELP